MNDDMLLTCARTPQSLIFTFGWAPRGEALASPAAAWELKMLAKDRIVLAMESLRLFALSSKAWWLP